MIENVYGRKYAERNFSYFSNLSYRSSNISVYNSMKGSHKARQW